MTLSQLVFIVALLSWLIGVGLLAHAVPRVLADTRMPGLVRIGMAIVPERIAMVMAIVIVSWPLSIPALVVMAYIRKRKEKRT